MKKTVVILWLVALLLLCFGLSYMINVIVNTYLPSADFNLIVLLCSPFIFLIFGGASWLVYFMMQKRKSGSAVKIALITFTFLVTVPACLSSVIFISNMRNRNEFLHLNILREKYISFCTSEIKSHPSISEIDSSSEKTHDFCLCVFEKAEQNPGFRKLLLNIDEPNDIQKNSLAEITEQACYDEYFNTPKP